MEKDMITQWLNDAGSVPLLVTSEVIRLGNIVQDESLPSSVRDKAVWKLVKHNLRLIPRIVRKCMIGKKSLTYGKAGTEDLLQAGILGLLQGARKFDPKLGYAFSTYASLWIYQSVQRYLYNNISMIRIPESTRREIYHSIERGNDITFSKEKPAVKERLTDAFLALHCSNLDMTIDESSGSSNRTGNTLTLIETISSSVNGQESTCEVHDSFEDILKTAELTEEQHELLNYLHVDGLPMTEAAPKVGLTVDRGRKVVNQAYRLLRRSMAA